MQTKLILIARIFYSDMFGCVIVEYFLISQPRPKTSFEIIKASILKRIRSPKDDEERDQGAIIQSVYDALNIKPTEIDFTKIKMHYWQFFSSPWASSMEYEERHLELAR